MSSQPKTRSPLRDPPLPTAGQSLERRLDDVVLGGVLPWLLAVGAFVLMALMAWIHRFTGNAPNPWFYTFVAFVAVTFSAFKIRRHRQAARRIRLGRDGERVVAETLQALVASGWRVFHDIPADGFNIDHVAIGPGGILAIETKTRSKPTSHRSSVLVTDAGVSIDGGPPDNQVLEQATRQSVWLAGLLKESTGKTYFVRPVVLMPGWYIDDKRRRKEPWVLERKELPAWAAREPIRLENDEIRMASLHLDRIVRSTIRAAS